MMPLLFEQSLQQLRLGELETGRLERKAESGELGSFGDGETRRLGDGERWLCIGLVTSSSPVGCAAS